MGRRRGRGIGVPGPYGICMGDPEGGILLGYRFHPVADGVFPSFPLLLFFIAAVLVEIESTRMKKRVYYRGHRTPHTL